MKHSPPVRVIEFYAGIGGMHASLHEAGIDAEVVLALDVNDVTRTIYQHNFPGVPMSASLVESVSVKEYDALMADIYLMSPPCQPYTRTGKQLGSEDSRAKSFLRIIDMLGEMQHPPRYLLVENVKGFETSETRQVLVEQLDKLGYVFEEFLLTPLQFGIPNSRLRYYLVARRRSSSSDDNATSSSVLVDPSYTIQYTLPGSIAQVDSRHLSQMDMAEAQSLDGVRTIEEFMDRDPLVVDAPYSIPSNLLRKHGRQFDIVKASSRRSCCFTKGYGHHVRGTGSILQMNQQADTTDTFDKAWKMTSTNDNEHNSNDDEVNLELLENLGLRYFSEHEIARLMGFPTTFTFPDSITRRQRYRALGNSLNVTVVGALLRHLIKLDMLQTKKQ
ncbi:S-adenosyl-L-methionine-dependent methyltransferase [Syncephalis plumigaleata]|nr:S-adenosyl-L-methionine-dependent methyltransferase [Syncephalis plumigaleata]